MRLCPWRWKCCFRVHRKSFSLMWEIPTIAMKFYKLFVESTLFDKGFIASEQAQSYFVLYSIAIELCARLEKMDRKLLLFDHGNNNEEEWNWFELNKSKLCYLQDFKTGMQHLSTLPLYKVRISGNVSKLLRFIVCSEKLIHDKDYDNVFIFSRSSILNTTSVPGCERLKLNEARFDLDKPIVLWLGYLCSIWNRCFSSQLSLLRRTFSEEYLVFRRPPLSHIGIVLNSK